MRLACIARASSHAFGVTLLKRSDQRFALLSTQDPALSTVFLKVVLQDLALSPRLLIRQLSNSDCFLIQKVTGLCLRLVITPGESMLVKNIKRSLSGSNTCDGVKWFPTLRWQGLIAKYMFWAFMSEREYRHLKGSDSWPYLSLLIKIPHLVILIRMAICQRIIPDNRLFPNL